MDENIELDVSGMINQACRRPRTHAVNRKASTMVESESRMLAHEALEELPTTQCAGLRVVRSVD